MNPSMITATSSSPWLTLYGGRQHSSDVVPRYSAGERRQRIERYRSKRERRNFHKKITYTCRKTLAENRRRIKGRFAHNTGGELVPTDHHAAASQIPTSSSELGKIDVDGAAVPVWWPAMEEALAREKDIHLLDEEMLASYLGVNLY